MTESTKIVYRFNDGLYLNITNRCPNLCSFCIKTKWSMDFRGSDLNLKGTEPSAELVLSLIKKEWDTQKFNEIVFCGYGEPTVRLEALLEIAGSIKQGKLGREISEIKIRLNTVGLANLVHKRDITDDLKEVIDAVAISINTLDETQWLEIVRPQKEYATDGFESVKEFIELCSKKIKDVTITAVENKTVDFSKIKNYADKLGIKFKLRPFL